MFEYELETLPSSEYECEFATEYENEDFFPLLAPLLTSVAPKIIGGIGKLLRKRRRRQGEFEFESEDEYEGDPFINNLLQTLGSSQGLTESEYEYEDEYEFETTPMTEYEMVMENLAYRAAHSESEAEAEAFLGALVPLAARLIPQAARAVTSVAPSLIKGVASMGRTLYKNPQTRQLLQTVPQVLKGTVGTLARQVHQGKPLSKTTVLRALAGNTAKILNNPKKCAQVMKKSHQAQHQLLAKTNGKCRN